MSEQELPLLAAIAAFIHWCEELLNILNGPILLLGAGIALVDLLTDGALTVGAPILLLAWAVSQALGIDTQLLGCFARARTAPGWARVGWLLLGVILGYAAWQAGDVFAIQQAQHISEAAALAQLHLDPALWLGWRAFLGVGLVALSGWTRYRRPAPASVESERERLERELALMPLRQQVRAGQVGGLRALAVTALQGAGMAAEPPTAIGAPDHFDATGEAVRTAPDGQQTAAPTRAVSSIGPDRPPTGPGSPAVAPAPRQVAPTAPNVLRLPAETPRRRARPAASARGNPRSARGNPKKAGVRTPTASVETQARAAWRDGMSVGDLQRAAHISRNAAMGWRRALMAEGTHAPGAQGDQLAQ